MTQDGKRIHFKSIPSLKQHYKPAKISELTVSELRDLEENLQEPVAVSEGSSCKAAGRDGWACFLTCLASPCLGQRQQQGVQADILEKFTNGNRAGKIYIFKK